MSYLNLPRLTFAGAFEADVNTVNNDVRNFDVSVFEQRFQTVQERSPDGKGTLYNGWWNPNGSNAFRLLHCAVTGAAGPAGAAGPSDTVLKLIVDAQGDRTSAKIVDLDPQFQFASALWGMRIVLTQGAEQLLSGAFTPTPFRDIYFGRVIDKATGKPVNGSPSASARFTGTLENVVFGAGAEASPVLKALKALAAANGNRLGMSLMTYGYSKTMEAEGFTFGSVIGSIGPWLQGQPLLFAPSRRFVQTGAIGYMDAAVSPDGNTLSVDFGNALPMWLIKTTTPKGTVSAITLQDLGPLQIVVLKQADAVASGTGGMAAAPNLAAGSAPAPAQYETVGTLTNYDIDWLRRTGGVADFAIPAAARALIGDHPLAILAGGGAGLQTVAIRETMGGMWVRADDFVQRLDSAPAGAVSSTVSIYAMRYGKPYAGAEVAISLMPPDSGEGGAGPDEVDAPQTTIPTINVPAANIGLPTDNLVAGPDGIATLTYQALNPNNCRGYLDGQIYEFAYAIAGSGQSPMPMFEFIAVHVRDAFVPPPVPSWATDVAPILVQYSNLYPIMSQGLFSLADFGAVAGHARLLYLAFSRPINDPNYMPATRDMSAGKLATILEFLKTYIDVVPASYGALPVPPSGSTLAVPFAAPKITPRDHPTRMRLNAAKKTAHDMGTGNDGKTAAVRGFIESQLKRDEEG